MTTELFEAPEGSLCTLSGTDESYTCTANCRPLSSQDYLDLLWTTLAEFPGECVKTARVFLSTKDPLKLTYFIISVQTFEQFLFLYLYMYIANNTYMDN